MNKKELQRLISLTFDESPKVRKKTAEEIGKLEDPGAMFALIELTYDKDKEVRETAKKILKENRNEPELMSFADIFGSPHKEEIKKIDESRRAKILKPIEKIFERKLGAKKAEFLKKKMMPTIEKIYLKVVRERRGKSGEMQELLSSYVEALSDVDDIVGEKKEVEEIEEIELGEVGKREIDVQKALSELEGGEEIAEVFEEKKEEGPSGNTLFRLAYDTMMASEGDEKIMEQVRKKMLKNAEDEIAIAFKLAKRRFKEVNITSLLELKSGMRSVTTDILIVRKVENLEYQRTKKITDVFTRVLVNDSEGNEGVIYLFEGKGKELKTGQDIKIEKGIAKTFEFSGETAITLGKRSSLYIVL
ncbi:HEAT repeat domain-containing protein [Candidatus Micrarchaeota archaeon]|nr:HEAT repeat domain-containing protein [Candidatus Micrarchaeota archaeon]